MWKSDTPQQNHGVRGGALLMLCAALCVVRVAPVRAQSALRPPAIPLVTHDPYFSVWSMTDRLTDDWERHWTGAVNALCGLARIDNQTFRFAGPAPYNLAAMNQTSVQVTPTRTIYTFQAGGVGLTLSFITPALPHNIEALARPVTYVAFDVAATDGKPHTVQLYLDASAEWTVNTTDELVLWQRTQNGDLQTMQIGTSAQPVLATKGDNRRIDWGQFLIAAPTQGVTTTRISSDNTSRNGFVAAGTLPTADDTRLPRAASNNWPVLATVFDCGAVGAAPVSRYVMLAYDDLYSIQLLGTNLRPYWRRNGMDASGLLRAAEADYVSLTAQCKAFDAALTANLNKAGGTQYAAMCVLAYRQCLAAHKIAADANGNALMFSKENFSNGSISTVDVLHPAAPFFLLLNTDLLRAQMTPILDYAASSRWKFPFAPHDLGVYPLANGQLYGGGETSVNGQMPIEESGNMILMIAAMARFDGTAAYASKYWNLLTGWASYLKTNGLDPQNQLSTDDFAGPLAHSANLSLKAIEAVGAYAMLCDMTGRKSDAATYRAAAQTMAAQWQAMAKDGSHYRLAFDQPGTWSQKYNLVWDKLLGLNLFPASVAQSEIAYYKTLQNTYGLPLDNRATYTKLDWTMWTATLATTTQDFNTLIAPLFNFLNNSPSRVPMTDWFQTTDATQVGFQARSVVGGLFIKALADPTLRAKYLSGTITLEGSLQAAQPITFTFRPTDGSAAFDRVITLTANGLNQPNGSFATAGIPANRYTVHIKGAKWLAQNIAFDATVSSLPNSAVTLRAGDSNNDNSVDSSDFTALIGSYNSDKTISGSGYDPTADFNDDGSVDSTDFTLLIGNFNAAGDP